MDDNSFICMLPILDSDSVCILSTEWDNSHVNFKLLHNKQSWSGQFQASENEIVADLLDNLSLTQEKYLLETKKALTTHGGADKFTYSIINNTFIWKKYVSQDMAIKFGFAEISKVHAFDVFEDMINRSLQTTQKFTNTILTITKKNEVLETENCQLKEKLNEAIKQKSDMEQTLYGKFLCLLNEKKKKISELKGRLDPNEVDEENTDNELSKSDAYNTDTDIDSECDDKVSHSKPIVEKESFDSDDIKLNFPKRTRQSNKSKISRGVDQIVNCVSNDHLNLPSTSKEIKSPKVDNFVLGNVAEEKVAEYSEEDFFTLPKRTKRTNKATDNKPATGKTNYLSDKTERVDSDKTLSQINVFENDMKTLNNNVNIVEESVFRRTENVEIKKGKRLENGKGSSKNIRDFKYTKTETTAECCKGFSSATLDILNQLI